ncbi:hypothetical protein GCM10010365_13350 [Streptomyces poonensis]|uniref:Uncharacterized protein n=1 Tax=Streptomyces poonensis TaxID=68255 RepID=A0A918PAF3_9ACTN|nr:hypothetical protein GCM10010365_13350 [Streptomyces poonensis]
MALLSADVLAVGEFGGGEEVGAYEGGGFAGQPGRRGNRWARGSVSDSLSDLLSGKEGRGGPRNRPVPATGRQQQSQQPGEEEGDKVRHVYLLLSGGPCLRTACSAVAGALRDLTVAAGAL